MLSPISSEDARRYRRLASFFIMFFIVMQVLDGISTQIGLRIGLVESIPTSIAILRDFGPLALLVEKAFVIAAALLFLWSINRLWERMSRVGAAMLLVFLALGDLIYVLYDVRNIGLIVAKIAGLVP